VAMTCAAYVAGGTHKKGNVANGFFNISSGVLNTYQVKMVVKWVIAVRSSAMSLDEAQSSQLKLTQEIVGACTTHCDKIREMQIGRS
jgi:hypothetical protein